MNRWPPLAATDTSRMCQWLTLRTAQHGLRTAQHGLRLHVDGASGGALTRLDRGVASTRYHQHSRACQWLS